MVKKFQLQIFVLLYYFLTIIFMFSSISCHEHDYSNYLLLRISLDSDESAEYWDNVIAQKHIYDGAVWNSDAGLEGIGDIDVMVAPGHERDGLIRVIEKVGLPYQILIEDVQKLIDDETVKMQAQTTGGGESMNIETFNSYDDILSWMEAMETKYPNITSIKTIGNTFEGRSMKVMRIGLDNLENTNPSVWIDGGIHAREWLSPSTVIWMMNTLLTGYAGGDDEIHQLIHSHTWYFLPVHNPDGYEYSRNSDRLWRKTRTINPGSSCIGADPNRNWNVNHCGPGSSSSPCDETYCGTSAHSEPCVQNVVSFLQNIPSELTIYFTIHTYSQILLLPYGYTRQRPDDYEELCSLADRATRTLTSVHGTDYTYGSINEILYTVSGDSGDFAYDSLGVKYSFGFELRDTGGYGFVAPTSEILPTGEETWAAVKSVVQDVANGHTGEGDEGSKCGERNSLLSSKSKPKGHF